MRRSVTDVEAGPVDAWVIFDDTGSGAAAANALDLSATLLRAASPLTTAPQVRRSRV